MTRALPLLLAALGALASGCYPALESMTPFACADDGTCPVGLACVADQCRAPALGAACQPTTQCTKAATGATCVAGVCATPPDAPRDVVARRVLQSVRVTWTAPAGGGLPLTGFTVAGTPGNLSAQAGPGATEAVLDGVVEGTTYSFTVVATNAAGASPAGTSAPLTITPPAPPGAPTAVVATAGPLQASVTWQPPLDDGGRALTHYTVTASPGGAQVQVDATLRTATVAGLSAGTQYTLAVRATNALGTGPAATSNAVTVNPRAPDAPTGVAATAGVRQASVTWTGPAFDGGSPVTGFVVTANPGGATAQASAGATSAAVAGLTPGTSYRFSVQALNAAGTSAASALSNAVVPTAAPPGAPTGVSAVPSIKQATVSWTAPDDNGGSVITGYTVTAAPGGAQVTAAGTARSAAVTGLSAGTAYTFTVRATNSGGTGPASQPSAPVTPTCESEFLGAPAFPIGDAPRSLATADFNGDGRPDLVVGATPTSVLLAQASGGYAPKVDLFSGQLFVTTGDFDNDGKQDVVGASTNLYVMKGRGDGTFATAVHHPLAGTIYLGRLIAAHMDPDGKLDLVALPAYTNVNALYVLRGNGDGTFLAPATYALDGVAQNHAVADFNGDGRMDVAVVAKGLPADPNAGEVSVFLGTGTSGALSAKQDVATLYNPQGGFLATDLDSDGAVDLAADDGAGDGLSVLRGRGDGTFEPAVLLTLGTRPSALAAADVNGDGRMDVAFVSGHHVAGVLLGNGNATLRAPEVLALTGARPQAVLLQDLDGDGAVDLAVANEADDTLSILGGRGDGTFRSPAVFTPATAGVVATADFNGDGLLDLVAGNRLNDPGTFSSRKLAVLLGAGGGTFQAPVTLTLGEATRGIVATGDFNADGRPDIVADANGWLELMLGNGDGTFLARKQVVYGGEATGFITGDFTGDTRTDVVAGRSGGILLLIGAGNGTFGSTQNLYTASSGASIVVATGDLNGDARKDVVGLDAGASTMVVVLANGNGGFLAPVSYPINRNGLALAVADTNGDGKLDVSVSHGSDDIVSVWRGVGDGTFVAGATFPTAVQGNSYRALVAADVSADGRMDLVAGTDSGISLLRGVGDATFRAKVDTSLPYARTLLAHDVTGDGRLDLLAGTYVGVLVLPATCAP